MILKLSKITVFTGILLSAFLFIMYILEGVGNSFSLMLSILYPIIFLLFPFFLIKFVIKPNLPSNYFYIAGLLCLAYFFVSCMTSATNVLLHYAIDMNYKERIAQKSVEGIDKINERTKQRLGQDTKIANDNLNPETVRARVLAQYTLSYLCLSPFRNIVYVIFGGFLMAFLVQKFNHND